MSEEIKDFHLRYTKSRYKIELKPYLEALQKEGVVGKEKVLDVGCGSGQWTIASALLNRNGKVYAVDPQQEFLQIAESYKRYYGLTNCSFYKMSYDELLEEFEESSFEAILCNSVLQYINWESAIEIFARFLNKEGILVMFWNHGCGYYLEQFPKSLLKFNLKKIVILLRMFTLGTIKEFLLDYKEQEYFVSFNRLKRTCLRNKIKLERIENNPKLNYKDKYLGLDSVFSAKGVKYN